MTLASQSHSLTRHKPEPLQLSSTNFPTPNRSVADCPKPHLTGLPTPPATQESNSPVPINLLLASLTPSEDLIKAAKDLVNRVSRKACIAPRMRTGGAKLPEITLHVLLFVAGSGPLTAETAAHLKALRTIPHISLEIFPARWTPSRGSSQIFRALHTGKLGRIAHTFSQIAIVLPPAAIRQNLPDGCRKVVDDCADCSAHQHCFEFLTNFVNVISHLLCSHLALSHATRFRYKPSLGRPAINIYLALDRPVILHESRDSSESVEKDIINEAVQLAQHSSNVLMLNATRCFGPLGQDGSENKIGSQETCNEMCESTKRNASMKLVSRERGRNNRLRPHTADASKRGVLLAAVPLASRMSNLNLPKLREPTLPTMLSSQLRFIENTSGEKQRVPQVLRTAPGAASFSLVVRMDCGIDVRVAELCTLSQLTNARRGIPCLSQLSQHATKCSLDETDKTNQGEGHPNVTDSSLASKQAFLLSPQPRSIKRDSLVPPHVVREKDREQVPVGNRVKSRRPTTAPDSRLRLPLRGEIDSTASRQPKTLASTLEELDSSPKEIEKPKNLPSVILSNPMGDTDKKQKQTQPPHLPDGLVIRPRLTPPPRVPDNSAPNYKLQRENPHYYLGSEQCKFPVAVPSSNSLTAGVKSKDAMQTGQNKVHPYVKTAVPSSRSTPKNSLMHTQEAINQRTGTQSTETRFSNDNPVDLHIVVTKLEQKYPVRSAVGCDHQRLVTGVPKEPGKLFPRVDLTLSRNTTPFKTSSEFGSSPEPSPGSLIPWGVSADSFPLPPTSVRPTKVNEDRLELNEVLVARKSIGSLDLSIKNHRLNGTIRGPVDQNRLESNKALVARKSIGSLDLSIKNYRLNGTSRGPLLRSNENDSHLSRLSEKPRDRPATSLGLNTKCLPPFSHEPEDQTSRVQGLHGQNQPSQLVPKSRDRPSASSGPRTENARLASPHRSKERSSTSLGTFTEVFETIRPGTSGYSPGQLLSSAETPNVSAENKTTVRRRHVSKHHSALDNFTQMTKTRSRTEREEEGEGVREQMELASLAFGGRSDRANTHQSNWHGTRPSATQYSRSSRPSTAPVDKAPRLFGRSFITEEIPRESLKHEQNDESEVSSPSTPTRPLEIKKPRQPKTPPEQHIALKSGGSNPNLCRKVKLVSHFKSPSASERLTPYASWVRNKPDEDMNALEIISESADVPKKNARVTPSLDLSGISIFSEHLDEALDLEANAVRYWW